MCSRWETFCFTVYALPHLFIALHIVLCTTHLCALTRASRSHSHLCDSNHFQWKMRHTYLICHYFYCHNFCSQIKEVVFLSVSLLHCRIFHNFNSGIQIAFAHQFFVCFYLQYANYARLYCVYATRLANPTKRERKKRQKEWNLNGAVCKLYEFTFTNNKPKNKIYIRFFFQKKEYDGFNNGFGGTVFLFCDWMRLLSFVRNMKISSISRITMEIQIGAFAMRM